MAEGDQVGGLFGPHDAGDSGHAQDIALGHAARPDLLKALGAHKDAACRDRLPDRFLLFTDIHHPGVSLAVKMRKFHNFEPPTNIIRQTEAGFSGSAVTNADPKPPAQIRSHGCSSETTGANLPSRIPVLLHCSKDRHVSPEACRSTVLNRIVIEFYFDAFPFLLLRATTCRAMPAAMRAKPMRSVRVPG